VHVPQEAPASSFGPSPPASFGPPLLVLPPPLLVLLAPLLLPPLLLSPLLPPELVPLVPSEAAGKSLPLHAASAAADIERIATTTKVDRRPRRIIGLGSNPRTRS